MPKDNRKIHSGVRHNGTVYKDGMEDELADALTQKQLNALAERGAISGNWTGGAAEEETDAVDDVETEEEVEEEGAENEEVEEEVEEEVKPARATKKPAAKKAAAAKKPGAKK